MVLPDIVFEEGAGELVAEVYILSKRTSYGGGETVKLVDAAKVVGVTTVTLRTISQTSIWEFYVSGVAVVEGITS